MLNEVIDIPRPRKWRNVCCLPQNDQYGPLHQIIEPEHTVNMTVEEYETIRLIDLLELTQEECSAQMNVARTTVQAMYLSARKKIAESIVNGKKLFIDGGNYKLCEKPDQDCRKRKHKKHRCHQYGKHLDEQE